VVDDEFFLSAEFIRRWEGEPSGEPKFVCKVLGAVVERRIFFGSARALPSRENSRYTIRHSPFAAVQPLANCYSLLAIRRSPIASRQSPFAAVLARQEPRPPNFRVLRLLSHVPFQVGGYGDETC